MPYANHVIVGASGTITEVPVTNEWILSVKRSHYHLSADKTQIVTGGVDFATITIQRMTPPLVDDSQSPVAGAGQVVVIVGNEPEQIVPLDANGTATVEIPTVAVGSFTVRLSEQYGADMIVTLEGV